MLRASCLTPEIKKFRCYEAKIEESENASSDQELNPGHLWLEPPVLCHWGLGLSGCCSLVAEYWRLKPEVSWVWLLVAASLLTFLYFRLITSKLHINHVHCYVISVNCTIVTRSPKNACKYSLSTKSFPYFRTLHSWQPCQGQVYMITVLHNSSSYKHVYLWSGELHVCENTLKINLRSFTFS